MISDREEGEVQSEEDEIEYLFLSKESDVYDVANEEWDDSLLIKEYDKAVAKAKREVLKKLQSEMELTDAEIRDVFSESDSKKGCKDKKNKKKKKMEKWSVGDACRAIYSVDGEEYEAEIVKMCGPQHCIVNFVGYNNQEEVLISDLRPSSGEKFIHWQIMAAEQENLVLQDIRDKEASSSTSYKREDGEKYTQIPMEAEFKRCRMDQEMLNSFEHTHIGSHHFPPPPPPPPTIGLNGPPMNEQAFHAMLMSWYMCGYYTGYYQRNMKES